MSNTSTVYGIDLGTTYSALSRINDLGQAEIVNNSEGSQTTPSAVFFEGPSQVVVGGEAKNVSVTDPDNSCLLIKRHMGTDYRVDYYGEEYSPESISALILREMVAAANQELGLDVSQVVITVPAYFGTQEREATRQAGAIAGLQVRGIVAEPVAAALSLGIGNAGQETIMVYDLGGGTFDTTIMKIGSGKVEVVNVDGNRTLGGADWDQEMINLIIATFVSEAGLDRDELEADEDFLADIQLRAEDAKKSLTKKAEAKVLCQWREHKANVTISREEFETATRHLIQQTVDIAKRTVERAEAKEPGLKIDRVLLVGGSSRMPQVQERLRSDLGWEPVPTDFDLAVAKGAAIYGQSAIEEILSTDGEEPPAGESTERKYFLGGATSLSISNVLARSIGIQFNDPERNRSFIGFVAHANDSIPFEPTPISASTSAEGQTCVEISLYEQAGERESENVEDNRLLKSVGLDFNRPMPKESPIDLQVSIDGEGLVRVNALDPESGKSVSLEASVSILSDEDVAAATQQVSSISLRS